MPSIRITRFAGLLTEMNPKALAADHAQIAHNCILWDGWLRPVPNWNLVEALPFSPRCLVKNPQVAFGFTPTDQYSTAVWTSTEPYIINGFSGIVPIFNSLQATNPFGGNTALGVPIPNLSNVNQSITRQNQSVYPISRTYAITYLSGNSEGPPIVLPQIGAGGVLFEGDVVSIFADTDVTQFATYGITGAKLYRTVPGFDTSEQLGNPVDTGFHLVQQVHINLQFGAPRALSFIDSMDSSQIPGDLLISDQWMPPSGVQMVFYGLTEGGWAINASKFSSVQTAPTTIQFSERYMLHAWPPQNTLSINDTLKDAAIFYDTVFIGTSNNPYVIQVREGEGDALGLNARPFLDNYACIYNTMCSTNFGAMYVTNDGLVALTADSDTIASRRVANPGDTFNTGNNTFRLTDVVSSAWWNGTFYGFTPNAILVFNYPNPNNMEFPLGQLTTIDIPANFIIGPKPVVTGSGMFVVGGNSIYTLPLPGYQSGVTYNTYTWKSKRFVMPGLTTFAGMKVVGSQANGDTLHVTINGYNNGAETIPSFVYSRNLTHSKPWRIPHQFKCLEFEIILVGNAVVQEAHLATAFRDLIEESNNG